MKIITVIGARPQFIKAATVSRVIKDIDTLEEVIVHTGQHYDENMSDIFFEELNIPKPNYKLGIGGTSHGAMTGQMLEKIEEVILKEKPDALLVYGDTNSTLAGALAASKLHIPVAHVEAGLRSFNKRMPEEQNRVLTDHLSSMLFVPTQQAIENMANEGVSGESVQLVGDVMQDAATFYGNFEVVKSQGILKKLDLEINDYILSTIHRAENTDDVTRMTTIVESLIQISEDIVVILPLHPRTKSKLKEYGLLDKLQSSVKLTSPLGYLEMVALEKSAKLIVTDSGGVQKEAYFHKTPCITLRDETEWVELLENNFNQLCPPIDAANIVRTMKNTLNMNVDFQSAPLYGNSDASEKIVEMLVELIESNALADK